mgnify:CR=1 FL=1
MKILVTGGAGFIGSYLTKRLVELKHEVIVVDSFESGNYKNLRTIHNKINICKGNILDTTLVSKVISQIDVIFHLAAKTTVSQSNGNKELYNLVNTEGTQLLLNQAKRCGVKKFIFASSAAIYGNQDDISLCESVKPKPISPLGTSKLNAEKHCVVYRNKGLDVIILRFFNVYGYGQNPNFSGAISNLVKCIHANKTFSIYGDGEQTRDFVYIDDVVNACIQCLTIKTNKNYIFNIASGTGLSINKLKNMTEELTKKNIKVQCKSHRMGEIYYSRACICNAYKYLNYKPKISLQKGLEKTITRYKDTHKL